jgi:exonuclease V gamma subunit
LPAQLVVFTVLDLPPKQLEFLHRLGQYLEIFIFHYNPSQEYWADSVDPNWKARYDARVKQRFIEKIQMPMMPRFSSFLMSLPSILMQKPESLAILY